LNAATFNNIHVCRTDITEANAGQWKFTQPTDSALVLDRVFEAYGFGTSLQLTDRLEMALGSMSAGESEAPFRQTQLCNAF